MNQCLMIGIAGGTGSGKSTLTEKLKKTFGDDITVISYDNYYRSQNQLSMEERKKTNYDHPKALETELLVEHLAALKRGETIEAPVYDFTQHTRSRETITLTPTKIILVEGILVLADKRIRELLDIKIYVDADADERILRRVARDVKERGRTLEDVTAQYLETVKPMHYIYVAPSRRDADLVVNSGRNPVVFDLLVCKIREYLKR